MSYFIFHIVDVFIPSDVLFDLTVSDFIYFSHIVFSVPGLYMARYAVGSKSFRPDIQKPRQMENAVRDI